VEKGGLMHARLSTLEIDPSRIDEAVANLEEQDIPKFRQQAGFKGLTLLVDRSSGKTVGTTYWESKEDMDAAEEAGKEARERAAETGGASSAPQVERFEVAVDTWEARTG
jgi:heme-degrading monooxygenase HmoA